MPNSARKTFHFEGYLKKVLEHVAVCPVCASRLRTILSAIEDDYRRQLVMNLRACVNSGLLDEYWDSFFITP